MKKAAALGVLVVAFVAWLRWPPPAGTDERICWERHRGQDGYALYGVGDDGVIGSGKYEDLHWIVCNGSRVSSLGKPGPSGPGFGWHKGIIPGTH